MRDLAAIKSLNSKKGIGKKLAKENGKPQKQRVLKRRRAGA